MKASGLILAIAAVVLTSGCSDNAVSLTCEGDCNAGSVCLNGVCRTLCGDQSECGDGELCVDNVCIPGTCGSHDECAVGTRCDESGSCVSCIVDPRPPCEQGGGSTCEVTCTAGTLCYDGSCLPACTTVDDCEAGELCSVAGVCLPKPCSEHADCGTGARCAEDSLCVSCAVDPRPPCVGSGANGDLCGANAECINTCVDGTCVAEGVVGDPCDADDNQDCRGGFFCFGETCARPLGEICSTNYCGVFCVGCETTYFKSHCYPILMVE